MLWAIIFFGYLFGFMLGFSGGLLAGLGNVGSVLAGLASGGLLGLMFGAAYWHSSIPPAFRRLLKSVKSGVLVIAVGSDKKLRFLPAKSDGFVIRPVDKPYSEKYVWAADAEAAYPVHGGKGVQAIIAFMGYPFSLAADKASAISRFRDRGFRTLEDLKLASELPSVQEIDSRIKELGEMRAQVEALDDKEVERVYGAGKDEVLGEIEGELEKLRRVRELVEKHGGGSSLTVNVDGATVRASDLISYLVWRHHPAELERIIKAETNAVLARMNALDWLKQLMPVIIVTGMMVLAILAAIYMLGGHGGAPAPIHSVRIGGG